MRDRLLIMEQVQNRMQELLNVCNLQEDVYQMREPSLLQAILGKFVLDDFFYEYLEKLDGQLAQVTQSVKRLENEAKNYKRKAEDAETVKRRLESEVLKLSKFDELEKEAQKLKKQKKEFIFEMIELRDNLLSRLSYLQDECPDKTDAIREVENQLKRTTRLLDNINVQVIHENGEFNSDYQIVQDVKPAPTPDVVNQVAETFRPGYISEGVVLRPQEVIIYTDAEGDTLWR